MTNDAFSRTYLLGACIVLAVLILMSIVRAIRGSRFTDRIVGVNLVGTMTIIIMCILSVYFQQSFLVDIAILYALLSFIAIVVLTRLVIVRRRGQMERERAETAEREAGQNAKEEERSK